MAMGKAVVCSDVHALSQMVQHKKTGLLHTKDDENSLQEQLERLVGDPQYRSRLSENARQWANEHRSWSLLTKKVENIYQQLISKVTN